VASAKGQVPFHPVSMYLLSLYRRDRNLSRHEVLRIVRHPEDGRALRRSTGLEDDFPCESGLRYFEGQLTPKLQQEINALIYTHLYSVLVLGMELCVLGGYALIQVLSQRRLGRTRLPAWRSWVTSLLILALLLVVLYAPLWLGFLSLIDEAYARGYVVSLAKGLTPDWTLGVFFIQELSVQFGASRGLGWQAGTTLFSALFLLGLVASLAQRHKPAIALSSILVIPLLTVAILTRVWAGLYVYHRFFVFILPVYLLFLACGVETAARLSRRLVSHRTDRVWVAVIVSLAVLLGAMSSESLRHHYTSERQNWPEAAVLLQDNVQAEDAIAARPWAMSCIRHYAPQLQVPVLVAETPEELAQLLQEHPRLWYIRSRSMSPITAELRTWLMSRNFFTMDLADVLIRVGTREGEINTINQQDLLEQAVALFSTVDNITQLGDVYMQQGRAREALVQYERAVTLYPDSAIALTKLGNAHRDLGHLADAQES
jgi:hypothetical protein